MCFGLKFQFFGFVLFYCSFFSGCDFCLLFFFRGLILGLILAPDELRTNFGLKLLFGVLFLGVELFGFWSCKNTGITAC